MNTPWDTLAAAITRLTTRVDALPSIREATVTTTANNSPMVRFDTDTASVSVYGSLAQGLRAGQRVLTLKLRHYVWILGIKGGNDTGWIEVTTFLNGFSAGGTRPAYRRIGDVVHLRGDLFRSTAPGVGGAVTAFNLPEGFRPVDRLWIATIIWETRVHVQSNGDVGIYSSLARTGSPGYAIGGVSFTVN